MERYRYLGTQPFTESYQNLFFGRSKEVNELSQLILRENIVVLHSQTGVGKTSLINAGVFPKLKNEKKFRIFSIRLTGYIDKKSVSPLDTLIQTILPNSPNNSYLDKIISKENSLWYYFKKLQASEPVAENLTKPILLVFDQFEDYFTYPMEFRKNFEEQLATILYAHTPKNFTDALQTKLSENQSFLTKEGLDIFNQPLNVKVLFSTRTDRLALHSKMHDFLPNILQTVYEIKPFSEQQAKEAIIFPAIFRSKYVSDNNFKSSTFDFSDEALEKIIKFLTQNSDGLIDTFQLQTVCLYAENIVVQKNITKITADDLGEIETIYLNFYENIISKLGTDDDKKRSRVLIEEHLIFDDEKRRLKVYEGIIIKNYGIPKELLAKLVEFDLLKPEYNSIGDCFYEIAHEALVYPILKSKNKRKVVEYQVAEAHKEKEQLRLQNEKQAQKTKRVAIIFVITAAAFIVSIIFGIMATHQKQNAETSSAVARATTLSVYAFQEMQSNPTVSLRIAEKALDIDKGNPSAISALLNCFYSANTFFQINTFYSVICKLDKHIHTGSLSEDGKYVIVGFKNVVKNIYEAQILDTSGTVLKRFAHKDAITTATISRDGKYVLTTSMDRTAKLWDIDGKLVHEFKGHDGFVWYANFSSDSKKIVSASSDRTAIVWDLTGKQLVVLKGHESDVYTAEFSPDMNYIVTSSTDNTARIWDSKGKLIKVIYNTDDKLLSSTVFMAATFAPDSKRILTINNDMYNKNHIAKLWDLNGNEIKVFRGHEEWLSSAGFTKDGKYVITTSRDKTIRLWDLNGNTLKMMRGHESDIWNAKLLPSGVDIISVCDDKSVRNWHIGQLIDPFRNNKVVNCAAISPDGLNIITASADTAHTWNLLGDRLLKISGHKKKINTAVFSPDGKQILTASNDKTAILWNLEGKQIVVLQGHTNKVNSAEFSKDGKYIITASQDSSAIVWDTNGKIIVKLTGHTKKVNSAKFSPVDENKVLTASDDNKVILWDLKGKVLKEFEAHENSATSASFSPDGQTIITTGDDGSAKLWSIETGKIIMALNGYQYKLNSAEFSPDGKYIVTTSDDKTARLLSLSGKEIMVFKHDGKVIAASFASNSKSIITVYQKEGVKTFKLWLISSEDILHRIKINQLGNIWKLDEEAKKKYGIQ